MTNKNDLQTIAANAIATAKTRLILAKDAKSVFFASLALKMDFLPDETIDTAATDGRKVYYNSEFVAGLPEQELIGVIAHEILHCASRHFARRNGRDLENWNIACDLAINPILIDAGFSLPACGVFPGKKDHAHLPAGLAAEEYFAELQKMKPDEQEQPGKPSPDGNPDNGNDNQSSDTGDEDSQDSGDQSSPADDNDQTGETSGDGNGTGKPTRQAPDPGQCGGIIDPEDTADDSQMKQLESEWKINVAAAQSAAERRGTLSAGLARVCGEALAPEVDWKAELRRFMTETAKANYNWKRPNKRHAHAGLFLPSLHSNRIGHIVAAIDTSGSITDATLTRFASELGDIAAQDVARITILYHDSQIVKTETWTPEDGPLTLTPCGGGGTDHNPVFDWLESPECDEPPALVVCLTDLWSDFPATAPDVPVLWCATSSQPHPFGERVDIPSE